MICQACAATFWLPDDYVKVRIKCPKCSKWADIPDSVRTLAKLEPRLARVKFVRVKSRLDQEGLMDSHSSTALASTLTRFTDVSRLFLIDELPSMARTLSADNLWESLKLAERLQEQSAESCSWWDYYSGSVVDSYLAVWYRLMMRLGFTTLAGLVEKQLSQSISAPYEMIFWKTLATIHDNLGPAGFVDYQDWLKELSQARAREKSGDALNDEQFYRFHLDAMERLPNLMERYSVPDCRAVMKRISAVSLSESTILGDYSGIDTDQYAAFLGCHISLAQKPESYSVAMRLGNEALAASALVQAQQAYERALAFAPKSDACRYNLGLVYTKQSRYAEAIESLKQAVELHPRHVKAWYMLGLAFKKAGDREQARKALEEGRDLNETWRYLASLPAGHLSYPLQAAEDLKPEFDDLLGQL
ncbi:MAG TPA: tetratricopeptide repeat protein [Candidatus Ozemobacteraceae bacterium]|nr:tetratricopeptide repeat protein [Candidatus Ozemobacteraceae bacterium]